MASEHYPCTDGPTEPIRTLAAEICWELDQAGDAGVAWTDLPCSDWASRPTFQRAIRWMRDVGVVVEVLDGRYRLAPGSRRTLPAHALSRVDLLDSLRALLGSDADPLEAIAELIGGHRWRRLGDYYERHVSDVAWRLYTGVNLYSLRAVADGVVVWSHTWHRGGQDHRGALDLADDMIAEKATTRSVEQMREIEAVGSW